MPVRLLKASDRTEWLDLWQGYCAFYETEVSEAVTEATWKRLLGSEQGMFGLVALDGEGLGGLAHCVIHPYTFGVEPACYLEDLYVAERARRGGVGRALIDGARERARASGCTRLYWHTDRTNARARSLYDRFTAPDDVVRYTVEL